MLLSAIATPAHAYQVQVSPNNPGQGDTLSIVVQDAAAGGESPTVTVNSTAYPSFLLSIFSIQCQRLK